MLQRGLYKIPHLSLKNVLVSLKCEERCHTLLTKNGQRTRDLPSTAVSQVGHACSKKAKYSELTGYVVVVYERRISMQHAHTQVHR